MEINGTQSPPAVPSDFAERLRAIEDRGTAMQQHQQAMEKKLDANTASTAEILALVSTFKGGMQFLGWLGVAAKWIGTISAAIAAVAVALHLFGGVKP